MEGFDPMGLPYLASPMSLDNTGAADYLASLPGIQQQVSLYDTGDFGSG